MGVWIRRVAVIGIGSILLLVIVGLILLNMPGSAGRSDIRVDEPTGNPTATRPASP
jgi:hypothetical protein